MEVGDSGGEILPCTHHRPDLPDRTCQREIANAGAGEEERNKLNDPASPTPVTDGSNVYVFFAGYGLLSYDADGKERWRLPLRPFTNFHGMGASPVLARGKVLMICDQDQDAYLLAVDQ